MFVQSLLLVKWKGRFDDLLGWSALWTVDSGEVWKGRFDDLLDWLALWTVDSGEVWKGTIARESASYCAEHKPVTRLTTCHNEANLSVK